MVANFDIAIVGGGLNGAALALALSQTAYRVALIDPPRGGLASSAIETLGMAEGLGSLFYLSCSPESLARDLKRLAQVGWQVRKIMPFDFFPRTRHLETLVWLARS